MIIWLKWFLAAAISVAGLALSAEPLAEYSERRAWRRFATWHCPNCGSVFGPQTQRAFWSRCDAHETAGFCGHFKVRKKITGGPMLRCPICEREFRMLADGFSPLDVPQRTPDHPAKSEALPEPPTTSGAALKSPPLSTMRPPVLALSVSVRQPAIHLTETKSSRDTAGSHSPRSYR